MKPMSRVLPVALGLMLNTACGDLFPDKKKDDDDDKKSGPNRTITYDPATFYTLFLSECTADKPSFKKTATNIAGAIIYEKICTYNATTKTMVATEKRSSDGTTLKADDYQEVVFNDAGRPTSSKTWSDSTKATLEEEVSIFYSDAGKLTKTESTRISGSFKYVDVELFDENEAPASSSTTTFKDGVQYRVEEDNCDGLFSFNPRTCERKEDGKVVEKVTYTGDEIIEERLINDAMVETERSKLIAGYPGQVAARTRKSFDSDGKLRYEETESCTLDGKTLTCTNKETTAAGKVYYTENSTKEDNGTVTLKIGGREITFHAFNETKADFTLLKKDRTMTGSLTGSTDPNTFNRTAAITFTVAAATNDGLENVYGSAPFWLETSGGDIDDLLIEEVKDASFNLKTKMELDDQWREVLAENFELTGVDTGKVDPTFRMKEVTTYQ